MTAEMFHVKAVELACKCGSPRRPNQRNCLKCHRQAQAKYRAEVKAGRAANHSAALKRIADSLRGMA